MSEQYLLVKIYIYVVFRRLFKKELVAPIIYSTLISNPLRIKNKD